MKRKLDLDLIGILMINDLCFSYSLPSPLPNKETLVTLLCEMIKDLTIDGGRLPTEDIDPQPRFKDYNFD